MDARLEELHIDSLRMVAIISEVEREFDVQFAPEDMLEFFLADRIRDLVGLLMDRIQAAS